MRSYSQAIGFPMLALAIVFVENIGAMLPAIWLASLCFGYYGIWGGYVLAEYLAALVYVVYYVYHVKRDGRPATSNFCGFLLLPGRENGKSESFHATIALKDAGDLAQLTLLLETFAGQRNLQAELTQRLSLSVTKVIEAIFASKNTRKQASLIDVMIEADPNEATVNLRFDGSPFEPPVPVDFPTAQAECSLHLGLNCCRFRIVNH
jgi:hypothetical protein